MQHTKKTYYGPKLGVQSMAQQQGRKKGTQGGVALSSGLQPRLEERWAGSALDAAHAVGVPVVVLLLDLEGIEGKQGGTAFGKQRGEGHRNGAGGRIRGRRASSSRLSDEDGDSYQIGGGEAPAAALMAVRHDERERKERQGEGGGERQRDLTGRRRRRTPVTRRSSERRWEASREGWWRRSSRAARLLQLRAAMQLVRAQMGSSGPRSGLAGRREVGGGRRWQGHVACGHWP